MFWLASSLSLSPRFFSTTQRFLYLLLHVRPGFPCAKSFWKYIAPHPLAGLLSKRSFFLRWNWTFSITNRSMQIWAVNILSSKQNRGRNVGWFDNFSTIQLRVLGASIISRLRAQTRYSSCSVLEASIFSTKFCQSPESERFSIFSTAAFPLREKKKRSWKKKKKRSTVLFVREENLQLKGD